MFLSTISALQRQNGHSPAETAIGAGQLWAWDSLSIGPRRCVPRLGSETVQQYSYQHADKQIFIHNHSQTIPQNLVDFFGRYCLQPLVFLVYEVCEQSVLRGHHLPQRQLACLAQGSLSPYGVLHVGYHLGNMEKGKIMEHLRSSIKLGVYIIHV